jgi:hypothetical protein
MNAAIVHWLAAPNASIERASVEKPPVGMVVSACATASKGLIRSSMPVHPRTASRSASNAVKAT